MAALHFAGLGVERDPAEFLRLLTSSAGRGHHQAQEALGDLLVHGTLVERDPAKGVALWQEAAKGGLQGARLKLSGAYSAGLGVERSREEALFWLSVAGQEEGEVAARAKASAALLAADLDPDTIARVQPRLAEAPVASRAVTVTSPGAATLRESAPAEALPSRR